MKSNNYKKPLLILLSLFLTLSIFLNLRDALLAQNPNRTLKSLLTNYLGKQIYFGIDGCVLKEINADHIVIEERFENNHVGRTYIVSFEAIQVVEIGQQNQIIIRVFGLY